MPRSKPAALGPGAAQWAAINDADLRDTREWARARTIAERIEAGLALSQTAHEIRASVRRHRRRARPA